MYIRAGSRTPTRAYVRLGLVYMAGLERRNCVARVHGEPTGWVGTECVVVFIGRAWTEQVVETRPGIPQNKGNDLVFDRPRSKRDPVHREGSGVQQNGRNGPPTVETGTLLIGRGVAYRKTGLHGILFISTVDLLQPPRATVDLLLHI